MFSTKSRTTRTLPVRTTAELESMREAGRLVATTLSAVCAAALPGVRLRDLDELAKTTIHEAGAASSFLGYAPSWAPTPFNGVLCLSPNEAVVHGRPTGRRLQDGDLLSVDCGAILDGWNGDAAVTIPVGAVGTARDEDVRLVAATEEALAAGIAAAVPGATLADIALAIDVVARRHGHAHLPDHGGHGIGKEMHEWPFVPNQPQTGADKIRLQAGNTIAIEPMLLLGSSGWRTTKDGWTIVTTDKRRAAHVEQTIAVTDDGPLALTVV